MRNFANKIWNASRFVMMNLSEDITAATGGECKLPDKLELEDKWILSKLNSFAREVCENLDNFDFGVAASKIYDFIWDTYCDWYIELAKPKLQNNLNTQKVLLYVLTEILTLLHPFMPFITEEIFQALPTGESVLMIRPYTKYNDELNFPKEEAEFESIITAIRAVRSRRAEMNVPPSKKSSLIIATDKPDVFEGGRAYISRLAYASELTVTRDAPADLEGLVTVVTTDARLFMPLSELVDLEKERERIDKEFAKTKADILAVEQKLANEQFTSKAPDHVVQAERDKLEKMHALLENLSKM